MIVKNEAHVIKRCLASVLPFIDSWAICDTGSTDGTQEIIREYLKDLPGELIERPWVDFSTNRNQALDLAGGYGKYALVMDADTVLENELWMANASEWGELKDLGYYIKIIYGVTHYWRTALVKLGAGWRYEGVLHECLIHPSGFTPKHLSGVAIKVYHDGARSQCTPKEKFDRDVVTLEKALEKEPDNARYVFYLAQSYRDAGLPFRAIEAYYRRVAMGGWTKEVYFSLLQIASLKEHVGQSQAEVIHAYMTAFNYDPTRAEAPCGLARYLRLNNYHVNARLYAEAAAAIKSTDDILFIDSTVYEWRAKDELAIAEYYCGNYEKSMRLCEELLVYSLLPEVEHSRVERNRQFAMFKLYESTDKHVDSGVKKE
jgi:tetratricopeptide (TPR) repeat protein